MRSLTGMLALAALVACAAVPASEARVSVTAAPGPAGTAPAPAPAAAPAPRAAIGDCGLDLSAGDRGVRPGDDFFGYANGAWYAGFVIPADHASYGPFNALEELSTQHVRVLIEAAAAAHPAAGSPQQQIGDYYASFMDEQAIEANGLAPAQRDLKRIADATSREALARLFALPGFASLFDIDLPPDFKNPDRYAVVISESSLGLPDRDYYLKDDPQLRALREKYVAYIGRILDLGGSPEAAARARDIMAFETAAAKVQWPIEKRRDVDAVYNPRSRQQLLTYAPGFPWAAFLESAQLGSRQDLVLAEITAIRDLAQLFNRTPVATLQAWLTFQYLSVHAPYLPRRFDAAHFAFYGQALRGQPEQRERWKRAVDDVDGALGEPVGRLYVAQYFPPES
ncbi:MAG TPA: M13 family metallopeptidase N-terminal domain-containing protein, partial [Steroidobacteraceae bacterium]|nr:M13 family metallopeptidase N-terminal domain-containing protein [Steroidobacteraceae bacterium]